jgi:hypothetical protein
VWFQSFLISARRGRPRSPLTPTCFAPPPPNKEPHSGPYTWSGHVLEDKRFITPARQESNPGLSSLYGSQLTDSNILDMTIKIHDLFWTT